MGSVINLVVALALVLPWWPGGSFAEPVHYTSDRIKVVDAVHGNAWYQHNLTKAIREWNNCEAGVRLTYSQSETDEFAPNTITVFLDEPGGQDPPYGGFFGGHGLVALAGGWTRSRAIIAHELGHALGFGHAPNPSLGVPLSIMFSAQHVQPIDCQGLRNYYD